MKKNSSGMLGGIIGGLLVPYLFGYCGVRDGHSGPTAFPIGLFMENPKQNGITW